jgi:acyl carrier protein phosphodiesterase
VNFLGHIFLTPDDDELLLGNFIADSVKGNPENRFPERITQGIRLHRAIDEFTDKHPLVKQGVERFRESQGRYAPVVIDVVYDHVLASNWQLFHNEDLKGFTDKVYGRLDSLSNYFPPPVQRYFPYMKQQNWLYNYQFEWGLRKSLEGLDRRSNTVTQMYLSVDVYQNNQEIFLQEFEVFLSEVQEMVQANYG